nr:3-isopropylmalate dehydratase small subunit [uncultured Oscillibacter sp.]
MKGYPIHGRVHKFGDNINTDLISPAYYIGKPDEVMIAHAMEGADPEFSKKVQPGDIIVAGHNFGPGSSRETAPFVIKGSGIVCVIASSYARIFFRNAINIGLPILTCDRVDEINGGDELEVDPIAGAIVDITTGKEYVCSRLPENIMELVRDGGLIAHLMKNK